MSTRVFSGHSSGLVSEKEAPSLFLMGIYVNHDVKIT